MVFGAIALGFLSSRALQGPTSVALPEPAETIRGFVETQPIRFEPNHGQRESSGAFFALGLGYSLELSPSEARLSLTGKTSRAELQMRLAGASESASARPLEALPGRHNYYLGRGAPTLDVPLYRKVRFDNIYEGIDIVYYGAGRKLEYDLVVAPGADPSLPRLELQGQTGVVVEPDGSLAVSLGERTVDFSRPIVYQLRDGEREPVEAEYILLAEAGSVGFRIGEYDPKRELVIDPVLGFATFFGGDGFDLVEGVGVASTGQVYITGLTDSSDLPVTNGSSQQGAVDGFVARYSPLGVLEFATYFGGSGSDRPRGLAVDGTDRALVTGDTTSADFPRTIGPLALGGVSDAFVARFNPDGTVFYARYLGGSGADGFTAAVAADTDGNAYLTGETQSADFPVVIAGSRGVPLVAAESRAYASGGESVLLQGPADAFVARIDPMGLIYWSDFLGGTGFDRGTAIAIDNASQAYVTGLTDSPDFPADGTTFGGGASDAFIARIDEFGLLLNSDFVGGSGSESGSGIGLYLTDFGSGVAYVAGTTSSADLPLPVNTLTGSDDAFVSNFDFDLGSITILWTRYIGGTTALESAEALSVDLAGNALIAGKTRSTDFPTTDGTTLSGFEDVFAARVNLEGGLPDATLFGGSGTNEAGFAVTAALSGAAWVGGETNDTDFPATDGTTRSASSDGFLARVEFPLEEGDLVFDESRLGTEAVRKLNVLNNQFADLSVTLSGSLVGLVESVAVEPAGTILLSENSSFSSSLPVIHRLDPGSGIATTLTSGMLLNDAVGRMAIEADGSILIVSNTGSLAPPRALIRVNRVTGAQSVVSTDAQMGGTVTRGIAVEPSGMIVALIDNTVARIDPMTGASTILTTGVNLALPAGVTIAPNGDILVVDPSNGVLVSVDPVTGVQTLLTTGGNLNAPSAVVVDRVGDVLVRDTFDFQIVRLDASTFIQTVIHSPGSVIDGNDMAMMPCTPTIANVSPANLAAGSGATAITITGECFTAGTVALADATALATTVNGATSITATITGAQLVAAGTLNITVQHPAPGSAVSNALSVVVAGPSISALTPPGPICAGDPGFTMLTIDGANFTPGAEVRWNGGALATAFVNSMQLTATIPGALAAVPGSPVITAVNLPGGTVSPGASLTVSAPSVGSVAPNQASVGDAATPIVVNGSCFVPGSSIIFNGVALATTFVNTTQLTATVPAASFAVAGSFLVRAMNPGGATSGDLPFNVLDPVPVLSSISPTAATAGGAAFTLTANGSAFLMGAVIEWDGAALPTAFVNSTQLTATVSSVLIAAGGTPMITVRNPAPGSLLSSPLPFVVSAPVISALTPAGPICAGDPAFTMLTVDGANFTPGAEVRWNGAALVTGFVNSTQLTATIPGALAAVPGSPVITAVNLPGGTVSPGASLTVSAPSVGSVVPNQASVGDAATPIALNGSCFVPGSSIIFNGVALATTFVNTTQLTATVPAASFAVAGSFLVRAMNPGGATSGDLPFNVLDPVPVLSNISPTAATAGGAAFTLTANGSSFLMGAAIEWDGAALPTVFVNSTQLTATVSSALFAVAGTPAITVRNPAPGSLLSSPLPFAVSAPVISALTPAGPICAGDPAFTMLTVDGANFTPGAEVRWNGAALVTGFVNATQLTATIPGALADVPGLAAITVVNLPGGATSPGAPLTVSPPAVGSIVPNQALVGDAATPVVANGSCFVPGSDLIFDGSALQTTFVNPTQLTATVPPASLAVAGSFLVRAMNPGGASSPDVSFNVVNSVPILSSVSPTGVAASGAAFTLTVAGSNFLAGAVIEWDGDVLPTNFVSPNQLTATVSREFFPDGGTALITVRNPPPTSAVSAPLALTVTNPAPTLTSLSPSSTTVGSQAVTVRLTGAGFVPSSQAHFDGSTVSTTFVSSTELAASLGASDLQSVGSQTVLVRNPSPGGGVSNSLLFDVVAPIPTISALTPPSTAAGGVDLTLTVSGSSFESGADVEWQGSALATTFASSRSLTAIVPAELIAVNGTANIVVVNPSGERSSVEPFLILSPAPVLSSISPAQADAGDSAFTLAITGEGFQQSSFAQWNGQPLPTVFQGPTQLSASVSASLVAVESAAQVTVRNLPPGGGTSGPAVFTIGPQALVSIAVSPTQIVFPPTVSGESTSRTVTVSNTGESSLSLTAGVNDPGFSVSPGTFSLNVGAARDLTIVYAPAASGSDSGLLRLSGDGISTNVPLSGTATEPPGGIEIQDPGGDAISGSVSMEPIEVGGTGSQGVRIVGAGPGVAQIDRIAISGAGFTLVGVPPLPLLLGPGEVLVVTILLSPEEPGPLSGQLLVNDDTLPIVGRGLLAGISIIGVPGLFQGGQQEQAGLSSASLYSTPITGVLEMDFTPEESGGVDDPAARFENGSRSATFTIPAGDSTARFGDAGSIGYQSGTSPGTLSFRAKLAVSGDDVTPVPGPTASGVIRSDAAPTLTSLRLEDRTSVGFTIVLEGFAPGRNVDQAAIRFSSTPGASVNPSTFDVNVAEALDEWFASAESASFGSQFALRLPVTISGQISAVSSVTASVSNENGSSNTLETSP